jgi:hypothetical protein
MRGRAGSNLEFVLILVIETCESFQNEWKRSTTEEGSMQKNPHSTEGFDMKKNMKGKSI